MKELKQHQSVLDDFAKWAAITIILASIFAGAAIGIGVRMLFAC